MTQVFRSEQPTVMACARGWYIYACILEPSPGDFLIKIGASTDPLRRVVDFRSGLPLPPTILYARAYSRSSAFKIERRLHEFFKGRRTFGEWFRFSTGDKASFHEATTAHYEQTVGRKLSWTMVTADQWRKFAGQLHSDYARG